MGCVVIVMCDVVLLCFVFSMFELIGFVLMRVVFDVAGVVAV